MNPTLVSSKDMGWRTPPEFLKLVRSVSLTGAIGVDPATTNDNPTDATLFFTPEQNGLVQSWGKANWGLTYCNPPYGRNLLAWSKKFAEEGAVGTELITLTPARTDTKWWRYLTQAKAICFLSGRLKFHEQREDGTWGPALDKKGKPMPAAFPCAAAYWGHRADRFVDVFTPQGWVVRP